MIFSIRNLLFCAHSTLLLCYSSTVIADEIHAMWRCDIINEADYAQDTDNRIPVDIVLRTTKNEDTTLSQTKNAVVRLTTFDRNVTFRVYTNKTDDGNYHTRISEENILVEEEHMDILTPEFEVEVNPEKLLDKASILKVKCSVIKSGEY